MASRSVVPFRCVPFLRTRQAAGLRFTNFSFFGIPRRGFLPRDFVRLVRRRGHCLSFGRRRRRRPLSSQLNIMAFVSTRASDEEFRRNVELQSGNYFQEESHECTNKRETKLFIPASAIYTKRIRILPRFTEYLCADILEENKIPRSDSS